MKYRTIRLVREVKEKFIEEENKSQMVNISTMLSNLLRCLRQIMKNRNNSKKNISRRL